MAVVDNVLGMDWSDATHIGDGVYVRDATDYLGIRSVVLRTDRHIDQGEVHHVIVLEDFVYAQLVWYAKAIFEEGA